MISVVIPVHNGELFVEDAIQSVFRQTYRDYEIIVVNDKSTDRTGEILKKYADQIQCLTVNFGNVSAARNAGLAECRGDFVAFLDADDIWEPFKLQYQKAIFDSGPRDLAFVFSDFSSYKNGMVKTKSLIRQYFPIFDKHNLRFADIFPDCFLLAEIFSGVQPEHSGTIVYCGNIYRWLFLGNFVLTGTMMCASSCAKRYRFNESIANMQDYELASRMSHHHSAAYLDLPTQLYRAHPAQLTKNKLGLAQDDLCVVEAIWCQDEHFCEEQRPGIARRKAEALWSLGHSHLRHYHLDDAIDCLRSSLRLYPYQLRPYLSIPVATVARAAIRVLTKKA